MQALVQAQIYSAVPDVWRDLLRILNNQDSALRSKWWYLNQRGSGFSEYPVWEPFLGGLLSEDAFVKGHTLIFEPRILHLSTKQQENLVRFIWNHKEDVGVSLLVRLLDCYEEYYKESRDTGSGKTEPVSAEADLQGDRADVRGAVARHLQALEEYVQTVLCTETQDGSECDWLVASQDGVVAFDVETPSMSQIPASQFARKRFLTQDSDSTPQNKRRRLDLSLLPDSQFLSQSTCLGSEEDTLPPEMLAGVERLKTCWHSGEDNIESNDVTIFSTCSPKQVTDICRMLDLDSLGNWEKFCRVLRDFTSVVNEISYTNTIAFLNASVLTKIQTLEEQATREVVASLSEFTKNFQRAVVEAVYLPCLCADNTSAQVGDLLGRLSKDALDSDTRGVLLRLYSEHGQEMSDVTLAVIHVILESKVPMDESLMNNIFRCLDASSMRHCENLRFGKLLLLLANKYGKEMNPTQLEQMLKITEEQQYFLKKTILSAIKRLKSK